MAKKVSSGVDNGDKIALKGKAFDSCFAYYNAEKKQISLCLKIGDDTLCWINGYDAINAINELLDNCSNEGVITDVTPVEVDGKTFYNYKVKATDPREIPFN